MSATAAGARPRSAGFRLTGTGLMLRFLLRRTWARLLVWPAVVVGMTAVVVAYYKSEFDTPEALAERAVLSNSAGMKAIFGHITSTGLGGGVWSEMWMFTAVMLAIGLIFLLTRTNRADEEHGRTELLLARPIATTSGLVASVAWLTLLCVVAVAGAAVVCGAYGLEWTGSWIMGASLGGVGLTGVAVAALANQLTVTSRDANGLALGILAVFYLLRTIGDLKGNALTWLSPIGWGERMDPWGHDRWWPLVLIVALGIVCITLAIGFQLRRDYGAGLVRSRPGPVGSAGFATTESGLTIRLDLGAAIAWVAGMALWGILLGSTLTDMNHPHLDGRRPRLDHRHGRRRPQDPPTHPRPPSLHQHPAPRRQPLDGHPDRHHSHRRSAPRLRAVGLPPPGHPSVTPETGPDRDGRPPAGGVP
ncbi:hypothetical protein [Raineyella sp. W15-4]|uniref:hypothetical protein n=1 Tax=Raineyella sp. W15-4 TaxID=3081651 RepID=UPI002955BED2|nr:hypothetical protein [Raineyella sp. W15-4]WOQ16153.1 hypothetical protein R0145_13180 [Raineyella sp. W15-4]